MSFVTLIPAYKPGSAMIALVRELSASETVAILVVNDGSGREYDPIFEKAASIPKVTVLNNVVNLGKGAALHLGFNHAACRYPDCAGIVTADADGQHLLADILNVARNLEKNSRTLIMGCRNFDDGDVPLRSRFGNVITRHVLRFFLGYSLRDTQTGLRGVPMDLIPNILRIKSRGYEFELEMLILCKKINYKILEVDIQTVYLENNKSSHFNPIFDSMRIYFTLLRFSMVALISAVIDYLIFVVSYLFGASVPLSQINARAVSMLFNYAAVKKTVFNSNLSHREVFPKYLALVVISGLFSYGMIIMLMTRLSFNVILAKMVAESLVFFANFSIQRDLIYNAKEKSHANDEI
jgi:putative flippase GtrA